MSSVMFCQQQPVFCCCCYHCYCSTFPHFFCSSSSSSGSILALQLLLLLSSAFSFHIFDKINFLLARIMFSMFNNISDAWKMFCSMWLFILCPFCALHSTSHAPRLCVNRALLLGAARPARGYVVVHGAQHRRNMLPNYCNSSPTSRE